VSSSQINLKWNASTDNVAVTGYQVFLNDKPLATTTSTSYSHTGLTAGTTYNYRVSAYDAASNKSPLSASVSATTSTSSTTATPSFWGDWESGTVTGSGNHNWGYKEAVAADRFTILSDGGARQGSRYARVEVRSGDNPLSSGSTERAEVSYPQDASNRIIYENLNSGTQQYAFSVKFDPSWRTITSSGNGAWGIFLQLHGPNGSNPAWALSATDKIRLNTRLGNMTSNGVVVRDLSNGNLNIGKWIDFIVTVKYAKDNTGYITIQRRDEGQSSFTQVFSLTNTPTVQYDPNVNNGAVGNHYFKHGLYRNAQPFTSILYLDGFTRTAVP
jgi:chitodextrinase